jgi:formamidopyrimidine-DNA glycosylase
MPELPEVETIKRQLHDRLKGRVISGVEMWKTGKETPHGKKFEEKVVGGRVLGVGRRAKNLIFQFEDGSAIVGHLKMTGKFLFVPKKYERQKHDRILFVLDQGKERLVWSDVRMFGYLKWVTEEGLKEALAKYGPEPLETSDEELADRLMTPGTRTIKAALLNQECIAGVGNIYADEACHRAGIRPTRRLSTLTKNDRLKLMKEMKKILLKSIGLNGTTANDYLDTNGVQGSFSALLKVYGRANKPCRTCKTAIKKIVLAGRGTHYCPACQK